MKSALWDRFGLFPRLAGMVAIGFLLIFSTLAVFGLRALDASTNRILEERMVLAEMAAGQIEGLVLQAFDGLLQTAAFAPFDPAAQGLTEEEHLLAHTYGGIGSLTLGAYFLDHRGRVVLAEPQGIASAEGLQAIRSSLAQPGDRFVSQPFAEPSTGHPAVAMTVALRDREGQVISYLGGLIDLYGPAITGPLELALKLGETGHAELVTAEGLTIASTNPGAFLRPGRHQRFYQTVLGGQRNKTIESVPYEEAGLLTPHKNIMALVPLSVAGWGLALGGDEAETLAPVASLRRNLLLSGLAMLGATLAVTLWGARRLIRPMTALTQRARAMSEGDLTTPVQVSTGGEIGVLARAFEEMRQSLLQALERLGHWNLELERQVKERSEQLARLQAQVEIERLKEEFVSQVSHELRTPLGLIKGYVTTLLRRDVSPAEGTRQEFLHIIREETEKLEALVEELLDTSRTRAGTFTISKKEVDLEGLLKRVMKRAKTRAGGQSLLRQGTIPLPRVKADAHRLEQVFNNLLDNAMKYSPEGKITVGARLEDGVVHFTVADEGESIPAEELGLVFDAFYRGKQATAKGLKGSGLGLTICRGIVEAHGGRIWAESAPGKGNRFHFTLPLTGGDGEQPGPGR